MLKCPQMVRLDADRPEDDSGICGDLRESTTADLRSADNLLFSATWMDRENNQTLEVRKNGDADAYEQYVYDQRYIDAPVMVYRDTNTDATVDQKLYITQDANFNVTATVNGATGAVVNRFIYTPYGQRTVLTSTWTAGTTDFILGHQGLYLDGESGLYYNRARYLHPTLGTFIQRDPLGYVDGGNVYQYALGSPLTVTDSMGLWGAGRRAPDAEIQKQIDELWKEAERLAGIIARTDAPASNRYVYRRVQILKQMAELRERLGKAPRGHSDFPGGDEFDWNIEDDDPITHPYNPITGTGRHFKDLADSISDAEAAIAKCDRDAFNRAVHRGQDYWSHYGRGYRYELPLKGGHAFEIRFPMWISIRPGGYGVVMDGGFRSPIVFPGTAPDDLTDDQIFNAVSEWTASMVAEWKCNCGNRKP